MKRRTAHTLLCVVSSCHLRQEGTAPTDMGALAHVQREQTETQTEADHAAKAAASADKARQNLARTGLACGDPIDRSRFGPICWTVDHTGEHERAAARHQKIALRHRAASKVLRDAESRACGQTSREDRDTSPFAHRLDVRAVRPLGGRLHVIGAEIAFSPVIGLTANKLQQHVDCHLARNAAIGHVQARVDMPDCPLALPGVRASVSTTTYGLVVTVQSDDAATAKEIVRRAQLLLGS